MKPVKFCASSVNGEWVTRNPLSIFQKPQEKALVFVQSDHFKKMEKVFFLGCLLPPERLRKIMPTQDPWEPLWKGQVWIWDRLGPGTLCRSACIFLDKHLLEQQNTKKKNYKGLKITKWMHTGTNYGQSTKRWKTQPPLLKSLEQNQRYCTGPPANGVGKPPKPPLLPDAWTYSYPNPIAGISLLPSLGASKENCYLFSLSPVAAVAPIKPCLNFLTDLLLIFID